MTFTTSVYIEKPLSDVYRYVVLEPKHMKNWVQGFDAYRVQTGRKRKTGSVATQVFNDDGHKTEVREEVLEIKPNQRFRCLLSHRNMLSEQDFQFLNQGDGRTKLLVETEVKLRPALFNLFSFFMKGPMRRQQQADLERLKSILEEN
jgi:uncharacterized protein YndB with AHSA1/START domain